METTTRDELKSTNYELFILALSILSLFNWVTYFIIDDIQMERVVLIVDALLSLIFLADFFLKYKHIAWSDKKKKRLLISGIGQSVFPYVRI